MDELNSINNLLKINLSNSEYINSINKYCSNYESASSNYILYINKSQKEKSEAREKINASFKDIMEYSNEFRNEVKAQEMSRIKSTKEKIISISQEISRISNEINGINKESDNLKEEDEQYREIEKECLKYRTLINDYKLKRMKPLLGKYDIKKIINEEVKQKHNLIKNQKELKDQEYENLSNILRVKIDEVVDLQNNTTKLSEKNLKLSKEINVLDNQIEAYTNQRGELFLKMENISTQIKKQDKKAIKA